VTVGGENLVSQTSQLRHTFSQTWQERRSSGKRGKSDVNKTDVNVAIATYIFTNVARVTFQWKTWQERRSSGKRGKSDVNVARATLTWQECDIHLQNVARVTFQWKTWQERRSSGKRGKSDVNVARATLTWQLRHTSSQTWQERRSSENVARETFQWKTWQERR
jgi:hypothetical protein